MEALVGSIMLFRRTWEYLLQGNCAIIPFYRILTFKEINEHALVCHPRARYSGYAESRANSVEYVLMVHHNSTTLHYRYTTEIL